MVHVIECAWIALPGGGELEKGPFYVTVEDETITGVHRQQPLRLLHSMSQCHLLTPGFIDLHTHGLGGSDDVMDFWQHPEHTQQIFPRQGTTSFLASVIFPKDHPEKVAAVLSSLRKMVGRRIENGAVLEGVHAEGPVVHDLGAMPATDSNMSLVQFEELLDAIPLLKVMTISPHLEAAVDYQRLKALVKRGVVPALGHDMVATEAEVLGALACGNNGKKMHITHLFNVCSFHHRSPSLVNFGLCDQLPNQPQYEDIIPPTVELIGDLTHVHPMVISTVLKSRNYKDIIFVSDSLLEPKPGATVNYLSRKIQVAEDCRSLSLVDEKILAGSCCTLLDTFHSLVHVLNVPIGQAVCMLAENPARIAGLSHIGRVEVGKRADLLLFDTELNLRQTLVAGRATYTKQ